MAPPIRTGINTVTRKQPDGSKVRHFYDRKTGRYLGTNREEAIRAAAESPAAPPAGSFDAVACSYLASTQFRALSPGARSLNRRYVDHLRKRFGSLPAAAITRRVVVQLRESEAPRPWFCTHILGKLRLVLQHGVDTGILASNPALRPGGVHPPRRHAVWSRAQTYAMLQAASPALRLALALLLYTAQRPGDVLAMTWGQLQEREGRLWLSLRQAKTLEIVSIPLHRELDGMLRERMADRHGLLMVPSPTGRPWAFRNFCRAWDKAARAAGIEGVQRRDLRRTAMVRMAEAGATTAQIAAVSGHTIDATSRILDTYIPRRGEVAAGAIEAWERGQSAAIVVPWKGKNQSAT